MESQLPDIRCSNETENVYEVSRNHPAVLPPVFVANLLNTAH